MPRKRDIVDNYVEDIIDIFEQYDSPFDAEHSLETYMRKILKTPRPKTISKEEYEKIIARKNA